MKHILILLFCGNLLLIGCKTSQPVSQTTSKPLAAEQLMNVAYGNDPRQKMDVVLPANRTTTSPFVIFIHGGAWVKGDKAQDKSIQDSLLAHGIGTASINHRYANYERIHYPEMLADVDSALAYCQRHAKEWNIRSDNYAVSGASSGGHLALLYSYTTPRYISTVVAFCPPSDLSDTTTLSYVKKIGLMPVVEMMANDHYTVPPPTAFTTASPAYHLRNLPTLLFHGTGDRVVLYRQSELLHQKLDQKGIKNRLITIPNADHDLDLKNADTRKLVYTEFINWLQTYGR